MRQKSEVNANRTAAAPNAASLAMVAVALAACAADGGAGGAEAPGPDCAEWRDESFWRQAEEPDIRRCAARGDAVPGPAVFFAISEDNLEALEALIGLGVDLDSPETMPIEGLSVTRFLSFTPLSWAARDKKSMRRGC